MITNQLSILANCRYGWFNVYMYFTLSKNESLLRKGLNVTLLKRGRLTTYAHESTIRNLPWGGIGNDRFLIKHCTTNVANIWFWKWPKILFPRSINQPLLSYFSQPPVPKTLELSVVSWSSTKTVFWIQRFQRGIHRRWQVIHLSLHHLVT